MFQLCRRRRGVTRGEGGRGVYYVLPRAAANPAVNQITSNYADGIGIFGVICVCVCWALSLLSVAAPHSFKTSSIIAPLVNCVCVRLMDKAKAKTGKQEREREREDTKTKRKTFKIQSSVKLEPNWRKVQVK